MGEQHGVSGFKRPAPRMFCQRRRFSDFIDTDALAAFAPAHQETGMILFYQFEDGAAGTIRCFQCTFQGSDDQCLAIKVEIGAVIQIPNGVDFDNPSVKCLTGLFQPMIHCLERVFDFIKFIAGRKCSAHAARYLCCHGVGHTTDPFNDLPHDNVSEEGKDQYCQDEVIRLLAVQETVFEADDQKTDQGCQEKQRKGKLEPVTNAVCMKREKT